MFAPQVGFLLGYLHGSFVPILPGFCAGTARLGQEYVKAGRNVITEGDVQALQAHDDHKLFLVAPQNCLQADFFYILQEGKCQGLVNSEALSLPALDAGLRRSCDQGQGPNK